MIWFTSDFHFAHQRDFIWKPRGFTSWEDAAYRIIDNYNTKIQDSDTVFILGDIMLNDNDFGINCMKQLKGHKYLAYGNHDSNDRLSMFRREQIFENIDFGYRLTEGKYTFWCSHYPMKMGNHKEKHPVWNLCGHTHTNNKFADVIDCCYHTELDAHNNFPISIEQIIRDIESFKINKEVSL